MEEDQDQENKGGTAPPEAVCQGSEEYNIALQAITEHHATHKTYSGSLLRPHVKYLKKIIVEHDIESILDFGCGKGLQYEWAFPDAEVIQVGGNVALPAGMKIEEYWGVEVVKYDPCVPKFAEKPTGKYDLVLCTHVLGCFPIKDLQAWALDELFGYANKFVYIAEAVAPGMAKKKIIDVAELGCPVDFNLIDWIDLIVPHKPSGIHCECAFRHKADTGTFVGTFRI